MNFRDLVGMYRVAIDRCVDIIATGESATEEDGSVVSVERIINTIDCYITLVEGEVSLFDIDYQFTEDQRASLMRYETILCHLGDVARIVSKMDTSPESVGVRVIPSGNDIF